MGKRGFRYASIWCISVLICLGLYHMKTKWENTYNSECLIVQSDSPYIEKKEFTAKRYFNKTIKQLAFLKVHKAGSTTVQGLFLRFGWEQNLTFVLPSKLNQNIYPNIISLETSVNEDNVIPPPPNKTYDILCCHVIYNFQAFKNILPTDTVFIGLVREPYEQFKSLVNYFRPPEIFSIKSQTPVLQFLRQPERYSRDSFTNNRMAYEFGFPSDLFHTRNKSRIVKYLDELDISFHIVIVFEYMYESLVLLKRILNWDLRNILYVSKNLSKPSVYSQADTEEHELYRKWAHLDFALYNFFYRRLWKQISEEGESFYEELMVYRRMQQKLEGYCIHMGKRHQRLIFAASKWNKEFTITPMDCMTMTLDEITFINRIKKKQYPNL